MKLVIIESPYQSKDGNPIENIEYARALMNYCLHHGWAPYASHLLYTQPGVLDDQDPEERKLGMTAGFEWAKAASMRLVGTDLGVTGGMEKGIELGKSFGQEIQYLELGPDWREKWLGPTGVRAFGRCKGTTNKSDNR